MDGIIIALLVLFLLNFFTLSRMRYVKVQNNELLQRVSDMHRKVNEINSRQVDIDHKIRDLHRDVMRAIGRHYR